MSDQPLVMVGTSGYSYKEWLGHFYPERLPGGDMLPFYAARFSTVEINNTFYRMPKPALLEKWAEQVPETFTFVLKAAQRITHRKRLRDVEDQVAYFYNTARLLDGRLGPIYFQLPPWARKDLPRLTDFLALLPNEPPAAFEFRHESWFDDEVYAVLRERDIALCISEADEQSTPVVSTASWGYMRLRRGDYERPDLQTWADRIRSQDWTNAYVYFKHEDEAKGPKLASEFIELLGQS